MEQGYKFQGVGTLSIVCTLVLERVWLGGMGQRGRLRETGGNRTYGRVISTSCHSECYTLL